MADHPAPEPVEQPFEAPETVGELAELYLGNILYAIELASLWLEQEGRGADAPFYRGIARKLAEAHGAAKRRDASPASAASPANAANDATSTKPQ